jgi:hypothetical protein
MDLFLFTRLFLTELSARDSIIGRPESGLNDGVEQQGKIDGKGHSGRLHNR